MRSRWSEKPHGRHLANDTTTPFANDDYKPCCCMGIVQPNVGINGCKFLRTISLIGDPLGVHAIRSEKPHGRHLANVTTTSFADDDYRRCSLMVTVQLMQGCNCGNLLQTITSIGNLIGVQAILGVCRKIRHQPSVHLKLYKRMWKKRDTLDNP